MKLSRYTDFLLESILYTSDEFKMILKSIKDDSIASDLLSLIENDIRTNYNILKTTDVNDTISFIPDNQAQTKLKSMNIPDLLRLKSGNKTSIGRIARAILKDNGISKNDKEIEAFTNKFKSAYDKSNTEEESIKIVKGEDIRYWYREDRYCDETTNSKRGTLGKSCMRYEEAQEYLDIYVKNPNECNLVIQLDEEGKLKSRALLWTTNNGLYLDRIYYTYDSDTILIEEWLEDKFKTEISGYDSRTNNPRRLEVQLSNPTSEYNSYPYMDTFSIYNKKDKKLYNYDPIDVSKKNLYSLQDTDGSASRLDLQYCEYLDEYYPDDECVWSDRLRSHLPQDLCVWSDFSNSYLYKSDSVYSKFISDYIYVHDSMEVYTDADSKRSDYYPDRYRNMFGIDEITGEYFLKDLLIEFKGRFYNKKHTAFVYQVLPESEQKYKEIYNSDYNMCIELDERLFGIKLSKSEYDVSSRRDYLLSHYRKVIYQKFINILDSLEDANPIDIKLKKEELEEADILLRSNSKLYLCNNLIYERFGNADNMIKEYTKIATELFETEYETNIKDFHYKEEINAMKDIIKKYTLNPVLDMNGNKFFVGISVPPSVSQEITNVAKSSDEYSTDFKDFSHQHYTHQFKSFLNRLVERISDKMDGNSPMFFRHLNIFYFYINNIGSFKQ